MVPGVTKAVGKFSYLPIKPQVSIMLSNSSVLREAFHRSNFFINDEQIYRSPFSGTLVKSLLETIDEEYIIPISLFFDEFTDVCPIGSFTSTNKKAVFQFKMIVHHKHTLPIKCFTLAIAPSNALSELITKGKF